MELLGWPPREDEPSAQSQWSALLRVRRKLLLWLLSPLLLLILVDAIASYYVAEHFASVAYDRTLAERARQLMLRVEDRDGTQHLRLSASAERLLLEDPEDRLFYRVVRPGERIEAGETLLPPPGNNVPSQNRPLFYDAVVDGEVVRVAALLGPYENGAS